MGFWEQKQEMVVKVTQDAQIGTHTSDAVITSAILIHVPIQFTS